MRPADPILETSFERWSRRAGLYLLAPLLMILTLPVAVDIAATPDPGFAVHALEVVSVRPGGPAERAGLGPGDRILGVDGVIVERMRHYYAATATMAPGRETEFLVRRGGANLVVRITPAPPGQANLIRSYSEWVAGLAFLMIGWWVFWKRPDPVARNFFGLCFIFAFFLMDIPDLPSREYLLGKEIVRNLLTFLLPAYFLRFFLQFPRPARGRPAGPLGRRGLLVPAWVLFALALVTETMPPVRAEPLESILTLVSLCYVTIYFVAGLIVFWRRALRRDRPIQRTKMMVILAGLAAGLIPFLGASLLGILAPGSAAPHWQYLAFSLLLVPASFGLAIMRYGALDRAFVVRTSLIYGLLTLLVLTAYFLIVLGLGQLLSGVFATDSFGVLILMVAASSLAILPLRRLVQGWIDRTFYPARQANRRAVADLADELTGLVDEGDVVSRLLVRLAHLYRPRTLVIFLGGSGKDPRFRARRLASRPEGPPVPYVDPDLSLAADSGLTLLLDRLRRPVFTEELEEIFFTGETDPASLALLTRLDAVLIIPLVSGNRLSGFLAFGTKDDGTLYSQEDTANLRALANQTASLIESRQLYQAGLHRKLLENELEMARDIQARLLPAGPLVTGAYAICGRNDPCHGVGGDYFDYFELPDGRLAVVIADVSGKGIPAALLMSSLRVAFRQEVASDAEPEEVVTRLNRTVAAMVSDGRFICFFFGLWDPRNGVLVYCNAGMDPPVVLRARAGFRELLKKGGPVLGFSTKSRYRTGTLALAPGDRLFFYTDGLTEEQGPTGDFYDLERLMELVAMNLESSPARLLDTVFASVRAFGGEEDSDDKTAIVLEIKSLP